MSELKPCPFCRGEMRVRLYDEDFYRAVLGTEYECDPEYDVEHVDRLAAAKARCPLEMECYRTEADAVAAWNTRDNSEFGGIPCTDENMKAHGWVRERTCENLAKPRDDGDFPFHCSECGAQTLCGDGTIHIGESFMLAGNLVLADAWHAWRYCPYCGAKVVSDEA